MQLMDLVIDAPEFARRGNWVSGDVAVAGLSRVAESLADQGGTLYCELIGGRSEDHGDYFELQLSIDGELQLCCQRCLEAMRFPLRLRRRLLLVTPGKAWPEDDVENEEVDAIEASNDMAVAALIEDEVLLALPISPRHDICGAPRRKGSAQDASPFAVLRKLKTD